MNKDAPHSNSVKSTLAILTLFGTCILMNVSISLEETVYTNFLHCLIWSGFEYSCRHSVMWSPILMRHCLVCSSCSRSDNPFSGLSSCFRAALTGRILSLHCNIQRVNSSNSNSHLPKPFEYNMLSLVGSYPRIVYCAMFYH